LISRREFLGTSLGAAAALALTPELLGALQHSGGQLIQRAIPSSGEMLPVIGVQFGNSASLDPAALKEVLRALTDNGGRFLDTMHQSMPGVEDLTASVVTDLGMQNKLFLGLRALPSGPPQPGAATPTAKVEALLATFKVPKIDLLQLPIQADPAQFPVLQEMKKEGRIRYVGATVIVKQLYPQLEALMRNEPIDFIGVDYSIDNRGAEETILPLARERKIGVVSYFPFSTGTLLVRAGTTQAKHMLDNIGGGIGRLPDEAMRKRMAAHVDSLPGRAWK
jgi:aryl-alcohol dehydrogenase-like predicted oxidoreductase